MRISDWSSDVCSSDLSQGRDPDCDRARSRIRMSYQHQFTGLTEGIRPTAPLRWRGLDGLVSAFWEAEGERGGGGYYISANPRISFFFTDVSSIRVTDRSAAARRSGRPMTRAFYVPAGTPMWTSFTSPLSFSHLEKI